MRHAVRSRLINNKIKEDRKEDNQATYRHKSDLKIEDAYKGYGQQIKDMKNTKNALPRKDQQVDEFKKIIKDAILKELDEFDLETLGVLEDESYEHNYNDILMSTDDIVELQCN